MKNDAPKKPDSSLPLLNGVEIRPHPLLAGLTTCVAHRYGDGTKYISVPPELVTKLRQAQERGEPLEPIVKPYKLLHLPTAPLLVGRRA